MASRSSKVSLVATFIVAILILVLFCDGAGGCIAIAQ